MTGHDPRGRAVWRVPGRARGQVLAHLRLRYRQLSPAAARPEAPRAPRANGMCVLHVTHGRAPPRLGHPGRRPTALPASSKPQEGPSRSRQGQPPPQKADRGLRGRPVCADRAGGRQIADQRAAPACCWWQEGRDSCQPGGRLGAGRDGTRPLTRHRRCQARLVSAPAHGGATGTGREQQHHREKQ